MQNNSWILNFIDSSTEQIDKNVLKGLEKETSDEEICPEWLVLLSLEMTCFCLNSTEITLLQSRN